MCNAVKGIVGQSAGKAPKIIAETVPVWEVVFCPSRGDLGTLGDVMTSPRGSSGDPLGYDVEDWLAVIDVQALAARDFQTPRIQAN